MKYIRRNSKTYLHYKKNCKTVVNCNPSNWTHFLVRYSDEDRQAALVRGVVFEGMINRPRWQLLICAKKTTDLEYFSYFPREIRACVFDA